MFFRAVDRFYDRINDIIRRFDGIRKFVEESYHGSSSEKIKSWAEQFMEIATCPVCEGSRQSIESPRVFGFRLFRWAWPKVDHLTVQRTISYCALYGRASAREYFEVQVIRGDNPKTPTFARLGGDACEVAECLGRVARTINSVPVRWVGGHEPMDC